MRLCRAYGRPQSEVWRQFDVGPNPHTGVEHLLEHALACYVAGGHPSFGFDSFAGQDENAVAAAALMTPIMRKIHPSVHGNSLPYCAMHVSQQTETFCYGPGQGRTWDKSPYFEALSNWTEGLGMAHISPDYVFDADFVPGSLARYKLLLMPLSMALSDAQIQTALEFVRSGGTLLLGPGAGQCDARGLPRSQNTLAAALGFAFQENTPPAIEKPGAISMVEAGGKQTTVPAVRHAPLRLIATDWQVLGREGQGDQAPPAVAQRPFGQGRVVILSLDGIDLLGSMPVVGGDAKFEVSSASPASGKYCLKAIDGPTAPQSYYPDLETRVMPFGAPDYTGGTLQFDLKVDRGATVVVDVRSDSVPAKQQPRLTVEPDGQVRLCNHALGNIPADQWIHATLSYDFGRSGTPSTCRVALALPDGKTLESPSVATPAADLRRTDRVVVFAPGAAPAGFSLDNLELAARKPDGQQVAIAREDFESAANTLVAPRQFPLRVADMLCRVAPPPIAIQTSADVRAGIFAADSGALYIHLHNRLGQRRDWQQPTGPEVVLKGTLPIREATLVVGQKPLEIRRQDNAWQIHLPPIGLYQVVELHR
jgi:hypothetical protein